MADSRQYDPTDEGSNGENRALSEIEAMYGDLVEMLPAIVYVAEPFPPYATIYVSPRIESLGYSLEEWLRRPDSWITIIHSDDREWVLRQTEVAMSRGGENDYEYRVKHKNGETRWLHDRGKFVLNDYGDPICWQGVLLDITARKEAQRERESLIEQLQKALADIKMLSGLLPICSYCKKVRKDENYWQTIETFVAEHSSAQFSHGICPDCYTQIVRPQLDRRGKPDEG